MSEPGPAIATDVESDIETNTSSIVADEETDWGYNKVAQTLLCGKVSPNDFKKSFSCHDELYKVTIKNLPYCAEGNFAWYEGIPDRSPPYLCRTTDNDSHCPYLKPEESEEFAFESGRCQEMKDSEMYPDGLEDYCDLHTEGGRQLAILRHVSWTQKNYQTPFVSTHGDLKRSINRGLRCGARLLTIIPTKKLLELGFPIVPAAAAMKNYSIDTDQPEIFDGEWLALWRIPRAAIIASFEFGEYMVERPRDAAGNPLHSLKHYLDCVTGAIVADEFAQKVAGALTKFEDAEDLGELSDLLTTFKTAQVERNRILAAFPKDKLDKTSPGPKRKRKAVGEMKGSQQRQKKRHRYAGGDFEESIETDGFWMSKYQVTNGDKRFYPFESLAGEPSVRFLDIRDHQDQRDADELSYAEFKKLPLGIMLPRLGELRVLRDMKRLGDTRFDGEELMSYDKRQQMHEIASILEDRDPAEEKRRKAAKDVAYVARRLGIPSGELESACDKDEQFRGAIERLVSMRTK